MPTRPSKKRKKRAPEGERKIADKADQNTGRMKQKRIDETGLTNRVRGHVSARGKRAQAKRDSR